MQEIGFGIIDGQPYCFVVQIEVIYYVQDLRLCMEIHNLKYILHSEYAKDTYKDAKK